MAVIIEQLDKDVDVGPGDITLPDLVGGPGQFDVGAVSPFRLLDLAKVDVYFGQLPEDGGVSRKHIQHFLQLASRPALEVELAQEHGLLKA